MTNSDTRVPKRSFSVLVVDDEPVITAVMRTVISSAGYDCRTASSGPEALEIVASAPCHLVVTDIRMPGMSGVELANALAADHPTILAAFMTGYAEYTALSQAIRLRPVGFLEKPFLPDQMVALVDKAYAMYAEELADRQETAVLEQTIADKSRELEFRTHRLLAEQELLRGIISCANFGLLACDRNGRAHLMNPLAVQLLGIDEVYRESYHGTLLTQLLPEVMRAPVGGLLTAVTKSGEPQKAEFVNPLTDRRLGAIAYAIMHQNALAAVVLVFHDVTEVDLLQKRLLQSAKLASLGELAAGVAHEINNPLGFVMSNCTTLTKYANVLRTFFGELEALASAGLETPAALQKMGEIRESHDITYVFDDLTQVLVENKDGLERVARIVRDLKTFAHPDSDIPQVCNVNALLDDALNLVRNQTKYRVTVERSFGDLPQINGHPSQLVQVFTNMFVNAAQAVKERGVLKISTRATEKSVVVTIRDDGDGIDERNLQRIFDPFFTTKPPGQGTGMGLSISYGIIQRHGGTIGVTSERGVGTEFTIELPATAVEQPADQSAAVQE